MDINFRSQNEQQEHDLAVQKLAENRFALDSWELTLNIDGCDCEHPDIVAEIGGEVVAIGEVETSSTVSSEMASQWRAFGESCPRFYLFVPEGTEESAAELLDKHEVACAGLRCYSYSDAGLSVRPVPFKNGRCRPDEHPWWRNLGRS